MTFQLSKYKYSKVFVNVIKKENTQFSYAKHCDLNFVFSKNKILKIIHFFNNLY